jgi:hypothetical protein
VRTNGGAPSARLTVRSSGVSLREDE